MWNPIEWSIRFRRASATKDHDRLRALRRDVWETTVEAVRSRRYELGGRAVSIDLEGAYQALHAGSVFHASTENLVAGAKRRKRHATVVSVHNADFLEIARALVAPDSTPAVLNLANRHNPGGGVRDGAGAQEENLFRRTNALYSLYQFVDYGREYGVPPSAGGERYPIPRESGGIYSPGVVVFRSSEATGYAFLAQPYRVNVITLPAINNPELVERDGQLWIAEPLARATAVKIRAILRIAARHGELDLVLGAFGCGAFRNPPQHVAELFREVLGEPELEGVFRRVAFAILDDHNVFHPHNPEGNYLPFERVLSELTHGSN